MALSVQRTARAAGVPEEGVELLGRAHALAMEPRTATLDEHAPELLHPGRSALVLLRDVGALPADVLAAAVVHESEHPGLRSGIEEIERRLGHAVAALVVSFPLPGDERLGERLVLLEEGPRLAALAEHLDQLRHAHLREAVAWWRSLHAEAGAVWLPMAERTHPRIASRYRHWHRAFGRRLERLDAPGSAL
jgi:hypothetical protein